MRTRTLPEWSTERLEYVEPTQVARSFGYDVFANEFHKETLEWNDKTIECVTDVDGDVASERQLFANESQAAEAVKEKAAELGARMTGITQLDQRHVYAGHDVPHEYGIVVAVPMDYDEMKYGGTERHVREDIKIYAIAGRMACDLAAWIRERGYPARAHTLRFEQVNMLPHAIAAGLGELGKHGSLINRELGCSFRLSMVTTDLPMQMDQPQDWGVETTCANCDMCVKWCPGDAIAHDKVIVRGSERWVIDIEACAPYWGSYYACGICLEVCPFNAKIENGKYRASLIDRINGFDRHAWNQQLTDELQIPWSQVEKPPDQRPGWRNRVRGSGDAAGLQHGIPAAGLPESIYAQRRMMGLDPAANED